MLKLISAEINQYCEENSQGDSELLRELTAYTYETEDIPQMISGVQVGNVLQGFIKSINTKNVIEVGMFTGYSALKMAEVLPEDGGMAIVGTHCLGPAVNELFKISFDNL